MTVSRAIGTDITERCSPTAFEMLGLTSSPSLLSDPRGEVSPVIVAKATLTEEPIWSGQAYLRLRLR